MGKSLNLVRAMPGAMTGPVVSFDDHDCGARAPSFVGCCYDKELSSCSSGPEGARSRIPLSNKAVRTYVRSTGDRYTNCPAKRYYPRPFTHQLKKLKYCRDQGRVRDLIVVVLAPSFLFVLRSEEMRTGLDQCQQSSPTPLHRECIFDAAQA